MATSVIDPLSSDPLIPVESSSLVCHQQHHPPNADAFAHASTSSASSHMTTSATAAADAAASMAALVAGTEANVAAAAAAEMAAAVVVAVSAAVAVTTSLAQVAAVAANSNAAASNNNNSLIILPSLEQPPSYSNGNCYDENNGDAGNSFAVILPEEQGDELLKKATPEEDVEQPVLKLLRRNPIHVPTFCDKDPDQLRQLLREIDSFVEACDDGMTSGQGDVGRTPGFWTASQTQFWCDNAANGLPYQCWATANKDKELPAPSVWCARKVYELARRLVQLRLEHLLQSSSEGQSRACSCIGAWEFVDGNVMVQLINQGVEQLMCQEASEILNQKLDKYALDAWNASYARPSADDPIALKYHPSTPIQILASRDLYVGAFVEAALAAKSTIQISTCYLFWDDPAHRYVLVDLLPHLVRTKGVKVQLLIDQMVVESFTLRSALTFPACGASVDSPCPAERRAARDAAKRAFSFVDHLAPDENRPPVVAKEFESPFHFLQTLIDLSHEHPDLYQVQFWSARDAKELYRVKSHVKCAVFDRQVALIGGSNITPTVKSAFADLDALVAGKAAAAIGDSFDTLWNAMSRKAADNDDGPTPMASAKSMDNPDLARMVRQRAWQDPDASVAILRSAPSSDGNDAIFRVVLDKIRNARSEVLVCMGHSSYCRAFADVVANATQRGVRVRILVNTLYSNDLRNGQADLFGSLRDLLTAAPSVEVYATTMPHLRNPALDPNLPRPDFIHAKYVVVDREWSATGSWNMWTRSAFYEIEHEAFIRSAPVAEALCDKFERDRLAHSVLVSADDCVAGGPFCPRGCVVCEGFGPFFKNAAA